MIGGQSNCGGNLAYQVPQRGLEFVKFEFEARLRETAWRFCAGIEGGLSVLRRAHHLDRCRNLWRFVVLPPHCRQKQRPCQVYGAHFHRADVAGGALRAQHAALVEGAGAAQAGTVVNRRAVVPRQQRQRGAAVVGQPQQSRRLAVEVARLIEIRRARAVIRQVIAAGGEANDAARRRSRPGCCPASH
jgi:hypothetical protein